MSTIRSLKSQMERDTKRVFLNQNDFAVSDTILYFRDGDNSPPVEYHIPFVIEEDGDMLKTWNKQESYHLSAYEDAVMQKGYVLFAALSDFQSIPRRKRYMQVGKTRYQISAVVNEAGMLKIKLRVLDE